MSQITVQGKQRALIRVAESRISLLDAVTATRERSARCVRALPVSPAVLKRLGVAFGTAATVVGLLTGLRRRKKKAEKRVTQGGTLASCAAIAQMLSPLLLPTLQRCLQKYTAPQPSATEGKRSDF